MPTQRRPKRPVQPPPPTGLRKLKRTLDEWWPTLANYSGWGLMVFEIAVDKLANPSALVLAGGLMGLKLTKKDGGD